MSDRKKEDFELGPLGSGASSPRRGERDGFLGRSPSRRPKTHASSESLSSTIHQIDNSPGASILAYCFSSISMTVVNKFVVSGQFWNLNFFYLAIQVRRWRLRSLLCSTDLFQAIVCVGTIHVCKSAGVIRNLAPFDKDKARKCTSRERKPFFRGTRLTGP